MPVRSLTQSLLRWPEPEQVLNQVRLWAVQVAAEHPGLERVGLFGSYGRGDAGVGSDLDLLLFLQSEPLSGFAFFRISPPSRLREDSRKRILQMPSNQPSRLLACTALALMATGLASPATAIVLFADNFNSNATGVNAIPNT
jgi:predicted nucleotidyltransferase